MRYDLKLIKGTLKSILITVNGCEGLETDFASKLVDNARDTFGEFQGELAEMEEFRTNEELAKLDTVFTQAGWNDQGLRWAKEGLNDTVEDADIHVVRFTNDTRTKWEFT